MDVDALAQEIRRVDGSNSLGAGALAEALMPFLSRPTLPREGQGEVVGGLYSDFTPITVGTSAPAVRDGVEEALREALVVIDADADVETWNRVNAALRALSTQEQGNG